jgi:hypothetical protein
MAGPYTITTPVKNQPIPSAGFGQAVKNAINDLDTRAGALETNAQSIIARGRRVTAKTGITTTETPVLRLDNIPVKAGRIYQINTSGVNIDGSVANDIGSLIMRIAYSATVGTLATIASAQVGQVRSVADDPTNSNLVPLNAFYIATADGYISILLSAIRVAGSGTIQIYAAGNEILDFVVQFGGTDPGDTGVVL